MDKYKVRETLEYIQRINKVCPNCKDNISKPKHSCKGIEDAYYSDKYDLIFCGCDCAECYNQEKCVICKNNLTAVNCELCNKKVSKLNIEVATPDIIKNFNNYYICIECCDKKHFKKCDVCFKYGCNNYLHSVKGPSNSTHNFNICEICIKDPISIKSLERKVWNLSW